MSEVFGAVPAMNGWEDLRTPANATKTGNAKIPTFDTLRDGLLCYLFADADTEQLYFNVQLPHSCRLNSSIYPHIHWAPMINGGAGEKVSWGLEYSWSDVGEVIGASTTIYANEHVPADSSLVQYKHYKTLFTALTGAGSSISSMLICRLFRDGNGAGLTDDYTGEPAFLEFDFHVIMDSPGSRQQLAKT